MRTGSKAGIAAVDPAGRGLTVRWTDTSQAAMFHHIWLRDNCACPGCTHPQTWERTVDTFTLDPDVAPVEVANEGDALRIQWNDGHQSVFTAAWLHEHRYGVTDRDDDLPAHEIWDASMQHSLPQIEHADVMADDASLLRFVEQVWRTGVTFVRNTPTTDDALRALACRVGHIRETNFGPDFHVVAMIEPNNVAYTAIGLHAHSDVPNVEAPPGFQFLHCIVSDAPGGDSMLVDGFWVAEQIRRDDPEAFALLSTVPVPYRFHDSHHDLRWSAPVIGLAADGALREVRFHSALTSPLDVEPELVEPLYRAMRLFAGWCRDPAGPITSHLEPGDVMVFHNRRILHGRTAFDPAGGSRQLHGLYVDVSEWTSRLRMLRHR